MRIAWLGSTILLAFAVAVAQAAPKEDVAEAAKKLAEKGNYSWKQTTENAGGGGGGGGGRGRMGPSEGKTADGLTYISSQRGDNTTEVVLKGDKGAVKTEDGWQSLAELSGGDAAAGGGRPGLGRFMARQYQNYKAPAVLAGEIAGKVKELKQEGDAYTGELTEEGVKSLAMAGFGGRGGQGGQGPELTNPKGTAKFWVKDGVLTKYEYNVQYSMSFGGQDREINRTTTVEFSNVGSTKVEVPEEAKKKLT